MTNQKSFSNSLFRLFGRPSHPTPFGYGGNLPYDDPEFSRKMLQLHLDDTDPAASRTTQEREQQITWFIQRANLMQGSSVLDMACGPGLYGVPFAQAGIQVTGIDFAPASIEYAHQLTAEANVQTLCEWRQEDMLTAELPTEQFDASLLLYGQLAVMERRDAVSLLKKIANSLRHGGVFILEMLNPARVDKESSSWWFTDDTGLWGDAPYLHLGERIWYADDNISLERYHIFHLDTGEMDEIVLCDQVYEPDEMAGMLRDAGFSAVDIIPHWGELNLYDKEEWIVYVATK